MRTYALNRLQHEIATGGIEVVRQLIHAFFLEGGTGKMLLSAVNGARSGAVPTAP